MLPQPFQTDAQRFGVGCVAEAGRREEANVSHDGLKGCRRAASCDTD